MQAAAKIDRNVISLFCGQVHSLLYAHVCGGGWVLAAEGDLLAENKSKVVLSLLLVSQVFETQPLQEAEQTLIIYGEL